MRYWPRQLRLKLKRLIPLQRALVLVAGVVGSGCVDERALAIIQNQVPQTGCVIPAEQSELYRPSGLLDLKGREGYFFFPLIRNDLPPTNAVDQQPERNRIYLRSFEVELDISELDTKADVPAELMRFSLPTSAEMTPGQLRSSSVKIVPDELARILSVPQGSQATLTAKVRVIADHQGSDIESLEFVYPVRVCDGCLVTVLPSCPAGDEEVSLPENFCGIPQDDPVACCNRPGVGLDCLASEGSGG